MVQAFNTFAPHASPGMTRLYKRHRGAIRNASLKGNQMYGNKTLSSYIECALWSSSDDDGEPLDKKHSAADISPEAVASMEADIEWFENAAGDLLDGIDLAQIGHDIWLTRNGHGVGFWDRGLGEIGDKLTEICQNMGKSSLYIGDDGLVYVA